MAGLSERRWRVQHFRSRACPFGTEAVGQVTGLPGRHLDAWLMPAEVCRALFARGARQAHLSLVEGTLEQATAPLDCAQHDWPGGLAPIAEALDLPMVALVTCKRLDEFHLPRLCEGVDAVLLDELDDPSDFETYRSFVTLAAKKPVIGAVEALPGVREAIRRAPRELPLDDEIFRKLGASFLKFADLGLIYSLARARPFPDVCAVPEPSGCNRFRVAYAHDEAFGAYFPDTLEALEALGAELVEFSPLRDESLPRSVDLVMIGCGFADRHAEALAENLSLIASLRAYVCRGQRIYSEGGGTAYLGRSMILEGRQIAGAGILPFDAELLPNAKPPTPVTRTLERDCWLGPKGTQVRGYKSGRWQLRPAADHLDCPTCFGRLTSQNDISFHHHAIGSLVHLHLGALRDVVAAFAGPHRPSLTLPTAHC